MAASDGLRTLLSGCTLLRWCVAKLSCCCCLQCLTRPRVQASRAQGDHRSTSPNLVTDVTLNVTDLSEPFQPHSMCLDPEHRLADQSTGSQDAINLIRRHSAQTGTYRHLCILMRQMEKPQSRHRFRKGPNVSSTLICSLALSRTGNSPIRTAWTHQCSMT